MLLRLKTGPVEEWNRLNWVIVSMALFLSTVIAGLTAGALIAVRFSMEQRITKELSTASEIISGHIYNFDIDAVRGVGATLSNYRFVSHVEIFGARKNALFSPVRPESLADTRRITFVIMPPQKSEDTSKEPIGFMYVWVQESSWLVVLAYTSLAAVVSFILIFLPSLAILKLYIRRFVQHPLQELSAAIDQTLETGDPTKTRFNDATDLGRFAQQFNVMQEKLDSVNSSLRNQTELSTEQADVLEQILTSGNQVVRHFAGNGVVTDYGTGEFSAYLLDGMLHEPKRDSEEAAKLIGQGSAIKRVTVIHASNENPGENETSTLYQIETWGPSNLLRDILVVQLNGNGIAMIVRDITEIRRMEEVSHHAARMESLGALTGGVAHDLNNILSIVIGNLELMELRYPSDEYICKRAKTALRAGSNGSAVVQSLLNFSRQKAEEGPVINIGETLTELEPVLQSSLNPNTNLKIIAEPELYASAPRADLSSAVLNLVVNARDAMPDGGQIRVIACKMTEDDKLNTAADNDRIVIKVVDQGSGISPDVIDRISEPFYTTKPRGKGTGMGLALVHSFAKRANGELTQWNNADVGATFCMTIPSSDNEIENLSSVEDGLTVPATNQGRVRVLIADDEEELVSVIQEFVEGCGHEAIISSSVEAAKKKIFSDERYDLVLTDLALTDGTGVDILNMTKTVNPHTPVILMTGFLEFDSEMEAVQERFATILPKPVSLNNLEQTISRVLST